MRSILFAFVISETLAGSVGCNYALEILALQDASHTFRSHVNEWKDHASELMEKLHDEFGEYKIGLAAFTDKPIPFSGYGKYGGFGSSLRDYCYEMHVPLSTDVGKMREGLDQLSRRLGSGFDYPEGQLEAMLLAAYDLDVGFSPPEVTHDSATGRPIARIMLMITDDEGHLPGNAIRNIRTYNADRTYPEGYDQESKGGFGSHAFLNSYAIRTEGNNTALYTEMAQLYSIADAADAGEGDGLTAEQLERLHELINHFGPERFPEPEYSVHPGDNSVVDCTKTEYPSTTQMAEALKLHNIMPIFLVSGNYAVNFFTKQNEQYVVPSGVRSSVASFSSTTLFDDMVQAISEVVDKECLAQTTTTSTTAPPDIVGTGGENPSEEAEVVPTEHPPNHTDGGESNVTEEGGQTNEAQTQEGASESTESGGVPPVVPPGVEAPSEGGSSNVGVIAGATGGAAAGVAAVAGILYQKFGMGFFSGNQTEATTIDQVETPDEAVEREAMEEVTMDMFN
eukprot:Protomagalhaensia_wolfi_Nauph_80__6026@NODE_82_length_3886_cov_618_197037_g63_i0_p2_GENE_NODE_82_length_3886_cov_618_197037_g63_i0NODE_82_length_3886_cov_618_197037_g63_i0_p2_ORF_typecomplete_len510_score131_72Integrin_beta/PF00362_18/3_2e15Integrin_beta/PF00362_18/2_7e05Mucin15/PF15672_5/0_032Polysacc_deac_1/PF01522_21/2_9Polysacc_deac_1/PF01522_21/2_4e02DUF2076/PF09849_9/0_52_NODE_82_length_3886_cov_618_197037_g63_i020193548